MSLPNDELAACLPASLRTPDLMFTRVAAGQSGAAAVYQVAAGGQTFVLKAREHARPARRLATPPATAAARRPGRAGARRGAWLTFWLVALTAFARATLVYGFLHRHAEGFGYR